MCLNRVERKKLSGRNNKDISFKNLLRLKPLQKSCSITSEKCVHETQKIVDKEY